MQDSWRSNHHKGVWRKPVLLLNRNAFPFKEINNSYKVNREHFVSKPQPRRAAIPLYFSFRKTSDFLLRCWLRHLLSRRSNLDSNHTPVSESFITRRRLLFYYVFIVFKCIIFFLQNDRSLFIVRVYIVDWVFFFSFFFIFIFILFFFVPSCGTD